MSGEEAKSSDLHPSRRIEHDMRERPAPLKSVSQNRWKDAFDKDRKRHKEAELQWLAMPRMI